MVIFNLTPIGPISSLIRFIEAKIKLLSKFAVEIRFTMRASAVGVDQMII
jgi:hypothetical protein